MTAAFAQYGFRGATLKEIAELSGIRERGLVHHIANKDELLSQVLEHRVRKSEASVPPAGGTGMIAGLLRIVRENLDLPGLVELHTILMAEATSPTHPAHEHYRARYVGFRRYVTDTFAILAKRGDLDTNTSPAGIAELLIAVIERVQIQWLYDKNVDVEADVIAFLKIVCPSVVEREAYEEGDTSPTV